MAEARGVGGQCERWLVGREVRETLDSRLSDLSLELSKDAAAYVERAALAGADGWEATVVWSMAKVR